MKTLILACTAIFLSVNQMAIAASPNAAEDQRARLSFQKLCHEIKSFHIKNRYKVDCNTSYNHFHTDADKEYNFKEAQEGKTVRIASYNLWHPGNANTMFKDLGLVAGLMNKWDIVAALELVPAVGPDLKHNDALRAFLDYAPEQIKKLEQSRRTARDEARLKQLKADLKQAYGLYRVPGYVKILEELRKLDDSWSLIVTPRGESWKSAGVQELVGFYYRARRVRPKVNEHCHEYDRPAKNNAVACIGNFRKNFMGEEMSDVFARRPFIASFESGNFDFTLVAAHIIFGSPADAASKKKILQKAFGVSSLSELGYNVNSKTYARYAELAMTMQFIEGLKEFYKEQDIIYMGDFNLESDDEFVQALMEESNHEIFIDEKTSLTERKLDSDGNETGGLSSNYDHFVMNKKDTKECTGMPRAHNYMQGTLNKTIMSQYGVRDAAGTSITSSGKKKMARILKQAEEKLGSMQTIKFNKVVSDPTYSNASEVMKERVFDSQIEENQFWRVHKEIMSDHLPISMTCKNTLADDDAN